jgi:hypothetical protein
LNRRELNRQIVAQKLFTQGYEEQEAAIAGWILGQAKPKNVRLGELPYVNIYESGGSRNSFIFRYPRWTT